LYYTEQKFSATVRFIWSAVNFLDEMSSD